MRIGLMENVPILKEKLIREKAKHPFGKEIAVESLRQEARYDLILSDKAYFPSPFPCRADLFFIPGGTKVAEIPEEGILLTGGMAHSDSVSFSSIGEAEAMLCVQQEICIAGKNVFPFEKRVPFDRNFSLYKNLATGFALSLAEILFTEEL